jgi:hypothetical protein
MRSLVLGLSLLLGFAPRAGSADQICTGLLPMGLLPPAGGFTTGCGHQFTLKLGASLGPDGNYILLDYPPCASGPCAGESGLVQLQCAAANGYQCCLSSGQSIPTLTGTNVATLVAGLNQRIGLDTDQRAGICYSAYAGNGARVANVPLASFPGSDRTQMILQSFASVFLVTPPAGSAQSTTVTFEFIAQGVTASTAPSWGRLKVLYR